MEGHEAEFQTLATAENTGAQVAAAVACTDPATAAACPEFRRAHRAAR